MASTADAIEKLEGAGCTVLRRPTVKLYRLSVRDPDAPEWTVTYFPTETELDAYERAAASSGWVFTSQPVEVPLDPAELARWLTDAEKSA